MQGAAAASVADIGISTEYIWLLNNKPLKYLLSFHFIVFPLCIYFGILVLGACKNCIVKFGWTDLMLRFINHILIPVQVTTGVSGQMCRVLHQQRGRSVRDPTSSFTRHSNMLLEQERNRQNKHFVSQHIHRAAFMLSSWAKIWKACVILKLRV